VDIAYSQGICYCYIVNFNAKGENVPQLLVFFGVVLGLTMAPGVNTALVIQNSLENGRRAGIIVILGGCISIYLHALFVALGLSALLASSAIAFELIRLVGSGYLIFLGGRALYRAWDKNTPLPIIDENKLQKTTKRTFFEGFISTLFTPEIAFFYLAVVPQYLNANESVLQKALILASIHIFARIGWYGLLAMFVAQVRHFMLKRTVYRSIQTLTGIFLVLFGIRLLLTRRVS
jgi:threonine/homoserine/homoserine lactone efflux protein